LEEVGVYEAALMSFEGGEVLEVDGVRSGAGAVGLAAADSFDDVP
jgi:hypothetical protein